MNTLLAYIQGDATYKVLSKEESIYEPGLLNFEHNCEFAEGAELDDDEWFKLECFNEKPYFLPLLEEDIAAAQYNQLPEDRYADITYLVAIQDNGNTFCFQRLTSQSVLKRKLLSISQAPVIKKLEKTIFMEDLPHAVYKKDERCLYFKRLSTITSVFLGIDDLYREATKEETACFMASPFMEEEGQIEQDKISSANRKRLHAAVEKLSHLTPKQQNKILDYIHKYKSDIPYNEATKKYSITNNTELQFFLWGIEERYFSTIAKREKRVARSILKLR